MPSRQSEVDFEDFESILEEVIGQMNFQRPFAQWHQDADTNRATAAQDIDDPDSDIEIPVSYNQENDPSLLPNPLPEPTRRRQQPRPEPLPSISARAPVLRPRKKVKMTDPELDFEIFKDETASVGAPFQWEYYGSSVPALGELKNGEKFDYTIAHQLRRNYDRLMRLSIRDGDLTMINLLERVMEDRYTTWQRFSGATEWTAGCDPLDVWLWVQDKGYHKRWTERQVELFMDFLQFMKTSIESTIGMQDPVAAMDLDKRNTSLVLDRFANLGLPNLHMVKNSDVRISFMPNGPDEKLLYRADFSEAELEVLDAGWPGPGRWAPGEGPQRAEEAVEEEEDEDNTVLSEDYFADGEESSDEEEEEESSDEEEESLPQSPGYFAASGREEASYVFSEGQTGFRGSEEGDTEPGEANTEPE